ncbi:MAG: hypothetical protein JWM32_47 [Verrucomicrobia bacterium]|nr:hypothetical protein [Verrucomicrobiota bacterium]
MTQPPSNPYLVSTDPIDKGTALRQWLKRTKLAESDFNYFRGIAKEFYAAWAERHPPPSPVIWSCGDVHAKNVGSFRADNGIAYFDADDFDDACLAPAHFDLGRAATGLLLTHGAELAEEFLASYAEALIQGKPYHLEAELAQGPVKLLFDRIESRTRKEFLKLWVKHDRIREITEATYRLPTAARKRAQAIFESWAKLKPDPKYYRVLDVCGSTAGIGSLCAERYLVLVRGDKKPHILDMKEATPSTLAAAHRTSQPKWRNEAQRAAEVQRLMQYMPIAHLGWTDTTPVSFVITEFQPAEDRMESLDLTEKEFGKFVCDWGRLVAWGHLRGAGWKGSPPTDDLIAFGGKLTAKPRKQILALAEEAAREISKAHRLYAATVLPEEG